MVMRILWHLQNLMVDTQQSASARNLIGKYDNSPRYASDVTVAANTRKSRTRHSAHPYHRALEGPVDGRLAR